MSGGYEGAYGAYGPPPGYPPAPTGYGAEYPGYSQAPPPAGYDPGYPPAGYPPVDPGYGYPPPAAYPGHEAPPAPGYGAGYDQYGRHPAYSSAYPPPQQPAYSSAYPPAPGYPALPDPSYPSYPSYSVGGAPPPATYGYDSAYPGYPGYPPAPSYPVPSAPERGRGGRDGRDNRDNRDNRRRDNKGGGRDNRDNRDNQSRKRPGEHSDKGGGKGKGKGNDDHGEKRARFTGPEEKEESDNLYVKGLPPTVEEAKVKDIFTVHGQVKSIKVLTYPEGRSAAALIRMDSVDCARAAKDKLNGQVPDGMREALVVQYADSKETKERKAGGKGDFEDKGKGKGKGKGDGGKGKGDGGKGKGKDGKGKDGKGKDGKGPMVLLGLPNNIEAVMRQFECSGKLPGGKGAGKQNSASALYVAGLPPDTDNVHLYKLFACFGGIGTKGVSAVMNPDGTCKGFGFVNFLEEDAAQVAISTYNGAVLPDGSTLRVSLKRQSGQGPQSGSAMEIPAIIPALVDQLQSAQSALEMEQAHQSTAEWEAQQDVRPAWEVEQAAQPAWEGEEATHVEPVEQAQPEGSL